LAIVDPPYGINRLEMSWTAQSNSNNGKSQADSSKWASYEIKKWDNERPTKEYWIELKRVSKNQIVWGANYFPEFFTDNMGVVFWDKIRSIDVKFSHGELAFTTFGGFTRKFPYNPEKYNKERWHPTQKPVALYDYLLREFAKEGDVILDTHLGSGASRISCSKNKYSFVGFEIDEQYYNEQEKRFKNFTAQQRLF
jgi:site-specific DNA-methyltransferase (adenine-specific)